MASKAVPSLLGRIANRRPGASSEDRSWVDQLQILTWPLVLCVASLLCAAVATRVASVDVGPLLSYFECTTVTLLCVLVGIFIDVAVLARKGAEKPLRQIRKKLAERAVLLVLPAFVLPAFLIGYTAAKSAIPFLVGYTWDAFWAEADRLIFGDDVWRIAWRMLGQTNPHFWEWFYAIGWGSVFLITANAVAYYGNRRLVAIYFTAMLATWLIGGCFMAYAFSAAGPVFAHLFDPSLTDRFLGIREIMSGMLGNGPVGSSQKYLVIAAERHVALKGGGISAMPSMHLGAATIYVIAALRTKWLIPALAFWAMIFVASGYFGFHYWVDGIVAAAVAAACWFLASRLHPATARNSANGASHTTRL